MSGSLTPNADALSGGAGGIGLAPIAQIIHALAPIFLGSGTTTQNQTGATTGTTTGTTAGTSSQVQTTSAPGDIVSALLNLFNASARNATDPTQTAPLISDIIRQSLLAFAPTIANANSAGIYNSSTLGLLGGQAAADAAQRSVASALNFQNQGLQNAANIGNILGNLTKTQTTTGTTGQQTTQQTAQNTTQRGTSATGPSIGNISPLLLGGAGLLGAPALINAIFGKDTVPGIGDLFKKGLNLLGIGGTPTFDPASSVQDLAASLFAPPGTVGSVLGLGGIAANGFPTQFASGNVGSALSSAFSSPAVLADPVFGPLAAAANPGLLNSVAATAGGAATAGTAGTLVTNSDAIAANNPLLGPLPGVSNPGSASLFATTAEGVPTDLGPGLQTPTDAEALLGLPSGAAAASPTIFGDLGSVGNTLLGPSQGSVFNLPSDIGNLISGTGSIGSIAADLANPVAGIAGGLIGGAIQPRGNPIGQTIGSTAGGLAAGPGLAALGAPLGPLGIAAGAIIGSLIGGAFGPPPPNMYSFSGIRTNPDGTLALGNQVSQVFAQGGALASNMQQQVDAVNNFLKASNLKVANATTSPQGVFAQLNGPGNFVIGDRGPLTIGFDFSRGAQQTPNLVSDLNAALPQLRFTSDDPNINSIVAGRSFGSLNDIASALQSGSVPATNVVASNATPQSPPASSQTTAAAAQPSTPPSPSQQQNPLSFSQQIAAAANPIFASLLSGVPIVPPVDISQAINPNAQVGGTG